MIFLKHHLIGETLKKALEHHDKEKKSALNRLIDIEEDINEYFINLYRLNDRLSKEVEAKDITLFFIKFQ